MTSSDRSANRVRLARIDAGLTQSQLADLAGVSRTAITAIEADRLTPSVRIALSIARALNVDVATLFGDTEKQSLPDWAWEPPSRPWRCHISEVRGQLVRIPVESVEQLPWPHDAFEDRSDLDPRLNELARRTLVLATCDPAASLLAAMCWQRTQVRVLPVMRSSRSALDLLAAGKVHVAGIHLAGASEPDANAALATTRLHGGFQLIRGAEWTEGIAVGPGMAAASVTGLKHKSVRWVGREPGSGARHRLDQLLGPRRKYSIVSTDHRGVVELVRSGVADAGMCVELVGAERGMRFIPIQTEFYDYCIPADLQDDPRIRALIDVLRSAEFRRIVGDLPGYSTRGTGEIV